MRKKQGGGKCVKKMKLFAINLHATVAFIAQYQNVDFTDRTMDSGEIKK